MVVPPVHVADNLQLGPRTYAILVKGVEVARGELYPDRLLAINPGHRVARRSKAVPTREPAFGLPAVVDSAATSATRAVGRRLHRRRSDDGAVDAPVGDDPHVPAGSAQPPADQGAARPRRRRRRRSWSRSSCRRSCRSARSSACCGSCCASACRSATSSTILEAMADAAAVTEGSGRDHRSGARGDGPRRSAGQYQNEKRRAAGDQLCAGARGASCCRRSCAPNRAPSWRSTRAGAAAGVADRARRSSRSLGTACAPVLADAPPAPVAAVRAGAAAPRRAVAQRGAAAGARGVRRDAGLTCI